MWQNIFVFGINIHLATALDALGRVPNAVRTVNGSGLERYVYTLYIDWIGSKMTARKSERQNNKRDESEGEMKRKENIKFIETMKIEIHE